ncbi:hypothetical protein DFQ27_002008 [Actinomortierella ambigua]|uniref:Uncharacterized protein n=1 Tax=Actinomortierella ambigua TaxID=1343610 RepID=A0A9P6Q8T7_9FUNG|nr:hypothetical protein DFQ27_002008 [Actinomortierella ambigua]
MRRSHVPQSQFYLATIDTSNRLYLIRSAQYPPSIHNAQWEFMPIEPLDAPALQPADVSCAIRQAGTFIIMAHLSNPSSGMYSSEASPFWGASCETSYVYDAGPRTKWKVLPLSLPCTVTDSCIHRILPGDMSSLTHAVHRKSDDTTFLSKYDGKTFGGYVTIPAMEIPFKGQGLVAIVGIQLTRVDLVSVAPNSTRATIEQFDDLYTPSPNSAPDITTSFDLSSACGLSGNRLGRELGFNGVYFYFWCQGQSSHAIYYFTRPLMANSSPTLFPPTKVSHSRFTDAGFLTFLPAPPIRNENDMSIDGGFQFPWALFLHNDGRLYALNRSNWPTNANTTSITAWVDDGRPIAINVDNLLKPIPSWPRPSTDILNPRPSTDISNGESDNDAVGNNIIGPIAAIAIVAVVISFYIHTRKVKRKRESQSQSPPMIEVAVNGTQQPQQQHQQQRPPSMTSCYSLPPYTERPSSRDWPRDEHEADDMQPAR